MLPTPLADTYLWSDGSSSPTLPVFQSGIYMVSVTANGCTAEDQVDISFNPLPIFSLGADTSICTGQSLSFDLSATGDQFLWQDGSTNANYLVDQGGLFWLQIQSDGCAFTDSILVQAFETPQVELGEDQSLCEGETALLDAQSALASSYLWSDGSSAPHPKRITKRELFRSWSMPTDVQRRIRSSSTSMRCQSFR